MILGQLIKNLLEEKGISVEFLASELEVTAATVYNMFKKDSLDSKHLLKIASILDVPITLFFPHEDLSGQSINGNGNLMAGRDLKNTAVGKKNEVAATVYERLLEEKERTIRTQQELIEELRRNRERE